VTRSGRDEGRHDPTAEPWWHEWWHLDFAQPDGLAGFVRLTLWPNDRIAWFWAYVVLPGDPGPLVVRDHEVTPPRGALLEVRADGLWAECTCETAFEHWTYGLEAFAVRLDDPFDALRGEIGERLPVGYDLEWEVGDDPSPQPVRGGYEQAGIVHGEVLVGRDRFEFDGRGVRKHVWSADEPWVASTSGVPAVPTVVVPLAPYRGPATALYRALHPAEMTWDEAAR
jgi:hypothetical protein